MTAAIAWIDSTISRMRELPSETVAMCDAAGRILAEEIVSDVDVPGFFRSMMDGFALQAHQTQGASTYNPIQLEIIGDSFPGRPYSSNVLPGQAVRIMTGAPMPSGADSVLPCEFAEAHSNQLAALGEVSPGKNVGTVGEDVRRGTVVFQCGRLLRPQDVGVLSSIGRGAVRVIRRPRVGILITGDELLASGSRPTGFRIADANGPMLQALVTRDGGHVLSTDIIRDDRNLLTAAMNQPADIILVSGGSSVGQEDHAPRILAEHGSLVIHGIAMRPSSPAGMGHLDQRMVFLLPGNPVSCLCAYDFFAGRAIRALGGRDRDWPYRRVHATLSRKLVSTVGRVDYARVKLVGAMVEPMAISGAAILTSTTMADGFVIVPSDSEGYAAFTEVDVFLY